MHYILFSKVHCILYSRSVVGHLQNYTGDRLNFGLAAEQAKSEGYKIEVDEHITSYDLSIAYHIKISL